MASPMIEQIQQRVSTPRLCEPAPDSKLLREIYRCALRAPDHKVLRPWRYLVVEGDARAQLGELFCQCAEKTDGPLTPEQREKLKNKPLRAPLILIGISTNQDHPKVPVFEQQVSCGVGIGYMLLALQSLGFAGMWRTGAMAENVHLKAALGISESETIVGFLYVGSPVGEPKKIADIDPRDYFTLWP